MRNKWLIGAALAVGLLAAPLAAQTVVQNQLSGNEVWRAAQGPGGPENWLWVNTVQGGTGIATNALSAALTIGGTSATQSISDGGNLIGTAAAAAIAVTAPANPVPNGAEIGICNGTGSAWTNTVTFTANSSQTVNSGALATLAASACGRWQFNLANTTWYRIQ